MIGPLLERSGSAHGLRPSFGLALTDSRRPGTRAGAPAASERRPAWRAYLEACRPHQWVKNGLVAVAPVAAGAVGQPLAAARTAMAVAAFCLASSAGYLLNDARDAERDRRHRIKRTRPVARGEISPDAAVRAAALLLLAGLTLGAVVGPMFLGALVLYALLTVVYTSVVKGRAPLDMVVLAAGFLVRAIGGAVAVDVRVSSWFFVLSLVGALVVVSGKRESELRVGGGPDTRPVLAHYTAEFLGEVRTMGSTAFLVVYCLWAFSHPGSLQPAILGVAALPLTVALLRYSLSVHAGAAEAPERLLLGDPTLLAATASTVVLAAVGLNFA